MRSISTTLESSKEYAIYPQVEAPIYRMKRIVLLLFSILIFVACEEERLKDKPYQYIAYYGTSLRVCAKGTIEFTIENDSTLVGTWSIEANDGFTQNEIGPQVGSGKLTGQIKNDQFYVNLNPGWSNNNIFLNGYYGDVTHGWWSWSTFNGARSSGSFNLKKSE